MRKAIILVSLLFSASVMAQPTEDMTMEQAEQTYKKMYADMQTSAKEYTTQAESLVVKAGELKDNAVTLLDKAEEKRILLEKLFGIEKEKAE